jgi:hypothetical protein
MKNKDLKKLIPCYKSPPLSLVHRSYSLKIGHRNWHWQQAYSELVKVRGKIFFDILDFRILKRGMKVLGVRI